MFYRNSTSIVILFRSNYLFNTLEIIKLKIFVEILFYQFLFPNANNNSNELVNRDRHRAGLPCCPAALPCPALPCRANLFFLPCPACPAGRPGQGTGQGRAKKFALLTFLRTWVWQGFSIELNSYQEELEYQSLAVGLNFNSFTAYYTRVSDLFIGFPLFFNV